MTTLTPHPCNPETRPKITKGYCTQFGNSLLKCPECEYGVWNLHQPFLSNHMLVCGWCFDLVREKGREHYDKQIFLDK